LITSEETDSEWLDLLPDSRPTQETTIGDLEEDHRRRALLRGALMELDPREREILVERHLKGEPATLECLSQRYGVSRERVRQIEIRAISKIATAMPTVPKEGLRIAETWAF
jgi:RNA polymerase sigma-32 factor